MSGMEDHVTGRSHVMEQTDTVDQIETVTESDTTDAAQASAGQTSELELVDELLIEEISIDGMCGVY